MWIWAVVFLTFSTRLSTETSNIYSFLSFVYNRKKLIHINLSHQDLSFMPPGLCSGGRLANIWDLSHSCWKQSGDWRFLNWTRLCHAKLKQHVHITHHSQIIMEINIVTPPASYYWADLVYACSSGIRLFGIAISNTSNPSGNHLQIVQK